MIPSPLTVSEPVRTEPIRYAYTAWTYVDSPLVNYPDATAADVIDFFRNREEFTFTFPTDNYFRWMFERHQAAQVVIAAPIPKMLPVDLARPLGTKRIRSERPLLILGTFQNGTWLAMVDMEDTPSKRDMAMARYPRLTAHMICESLGYACPRTAINIILDGHARRENWCEWLSACYGCNAFKCLKDAVQHRKSHHGYMSDYGHALAIVRRAVQDGVHPVLASWF